MELLGFLAGACAGHVSEEVWLARGMLQGDDPAPSVQRSQKRAGLERVLGCSPEIQEVGIGAHVTYSSLAEAMCGQ